MATFPGGVKVFTNKTDGVSVNAAVDINDLQNEVNAIEDGYLNGSARLNSSNSTHTALSVTGGSTLATLQVTGASSFATLNVTGASSFAVHPVMGPPEAAVVFLQDAYDPGSSAASTLSWKAEHLITNSSAHSTASNSERLIPQSTGLHQFTLQVRYTGQPATSVFGRLTIQDSSNSAIAQVQQIVSSAGAPNIFQVMGYKRYDAIGGFATVVLTNAGPGASTLSVSTGYGVTWFSMVKL